MLNVFFICRNSSPILRLKMSDVVKILEDDGVGLLRDGCHKKEPLWIVFVMSGTINLTSTLMVLSFKMIDGRGQGVKITDKGLRLEKSEHVIICNLQFEGGDKENVDAIQIKSKSTNIWIVRWNLRNYADNLIDVSHESTNITISSKCCFEMHDKTMLIGRSPDDIGDRSIAVTIHCCFFDSTI
nr:unnamed protein product [Ananas comosus var. bracteatus]